MATRAEAVPGGRGIWKPVLAGVVLAAPFVVGIVLLRSITLDFLAFLLALTGGIYVGSALSGARRGALALESLAGLVCLFCALLSLFWASVWLAWGFLFNAAWDAVHHRHDFGAPVRRWFPPFCAAFDVVIAVAVLLLR